MAEKRPPRIVGPGHDTFWDWCSKGELAIQRCGNCGHRPWPVIETCEECGSDKLEFEPIAVIRGADTGAEALSTS